MLSAVGHCGTNGTAYFTVTNSGANMFVAQPYRIADANGSTIVSGSIQLASGQITPIPVSDTSGIVIFISGTTIVDHANKL